MYDICLTKLGDCCDINEDYTCDICMNKLAYISISVPEGCLVNGLQTDEHYNMWTSFTVAFSYVGSDGRRVKEWVIYTSDGNEAGRVNHGERYTINEQGDYYATPIFLEQ